MHVAVSVLFIDYVPEVVACAAYNVNLGEALLELFRSESNPSLIVKIDIQCIRVGSDR